MSSRGTVKRQGRPNRGGGKFNRGGGRGRGGNRPGRGRGNAGGQVHKKPTVAGWHAGKGEYDYRWDALDNEGDGASDEDYMENNHAYGASSNKVQNSTWKDPYSGGGGGGGSGARTSRDEPYKEKRIRNRNMKVPMQHLHMSEENQDLVRDVLQELHGGHSLDIQSDEEYDELDWRAEDQYWLTDNQLVVEEMQVYPDKTYLDKKGQEAISKVEIANSQKIGLSKLQRYGFDEKRCISALHEAEGDIGKALEYLLSECFDLGLNLNNDIDYLSEGEGEDDVKTANNVESSDILWEEILEQRTEEALALASIYEDGFKERIKNKIWIISLELPHLTELFMVKKEAKIQEEKIKMALKIKNENQRICHFFKKGICRYGKRCRDRHQVEYMEVEEKKREDIENNLEKYPFELEVRFPPGNRYPEEAPLVAFSTTSVFVPKQVCLNITSRLFKEAQDPANLGMPVIFTLVSILDNIDDLAKICEEQPHAFSLPKPVISRKMLPMAKTIEPVMNKRGAKPKPGEVDSFSEFLDEPQRRSLNNQDEDGLEETNKQEEYRKKYARSNKHANGKKTDTGETRKLDNRTRERFIRKQDTESYKRMMAQRQKLPAWDLQEKVLRTVEGSQVTVISGMTGCGKTTQVPQFLLDDTLLDRKVQVSNIICTQPRRISAMAVAQRVAEERVEKIGNTVGYQIRLESVMSSSTRLLFCTTGILLRRLEGDGMLETVSHIILDEVHERTEESDFLLMVLRDLLKKRRNLKLILMSATLNADLFSDYFGGCPVVEIPGRTFPVKQLFLEDVIECTRYVMEEGSPFARPVKFSNSNRPQAKTQNMRPPTEEIDDELYHLTSTANLPVPKVNTQDQKLSIKQMYVRYNGYSKSTVKTLTIMDHDKINYDLVEAVLEYIVQGRHEYPQDGACLVFLPGMQEITTMYEQLQQSHTFGGKNKQHYKIIPLHSTLSSEDQQAVFKRPKEGVTKIVLATNIAETSITIDDVVFVIDCGRMKEKRYDPCKGMESLELVWVSRANALQRKGRAGRVAAGVCFHMFTTNRYESHFREQPIPEIQRIPLESLILRIKILDIFRGRAVEDVLSKLVEPPPEESSSNAIKRLQDLGALDSDCHLTPLGYHLASLPVDVRIGKLMLFGSIFRCLDSALTVAATLSFKSPFVSPFDKRDEADKKKMEFAVGNSDHLTMLKAYKSWISANKRGSYAGYCYCQENYLSVKTMQMLASMKRQFVELLSDIGFVKEGLSSRDMERLTRDGGDGVLESTGTDANSNSNNMKLLAAILVAALYPNVVQVRTPEARYHVTGMGTVPKAPKPEELKFVTKMDGYINIHPSSVNFHVRHYESPYLVYHEKIKTSKVYIRDSTMVSVYPMLLFGGGSISIDLDRGNFVLSVDDGWIRFMAASNEVAQLVKELRLELDQLLQDKIEQPNMDLTTCPRGSKIIHAIVKLVTTQ